MSTVRRLIRRKPRKTRRTEGAGGEPAVRTAEENDEYLACGPWHGLAGFERFCERHVWVEDKESDTGESHLIFWRGQRIVAALLVLGLWILLVKARQLGITWLWAAYVVWRAIYSPHHFQCVVIFQLKEPYAYEFVSRVRFVHDRLPGFFQMQPLGDAKGKLQWKGHGHLADIYALAGGDDAARSFTGDLAIFDEAPRIPEFGLTYGGVAPGMRRSRSTRHGQLVVGGSSKGPEGDFKDLWDKTYGEDGELLDENGVGPSGFVPVFLSVFDRPGRDETWYDQRKQELDRISPVLVKQEYPQNVDEAWEYAAGRVFPLFTRSRNVGSIEIPVDAQRCRLIDWGESKSAYVVLWVAYIDGPPGFLVHPDCTNTIREFLAYRFDDSGRPEKKNDHTPDAVRYGVVTYDWRGLVYIYRELYRLDSVAAGWNPYTEIAEIHELSGWVKAEPGSRRYYRRGPKGEYYELSAVADPSMGKMINEFCMFDIPCVGARRIVGQRDGKEKQNAPAEYRIEGIRAVAALIDGSQAMDRYYAVTRRGRLAQILHQHSKPRIRGSQTMEMTRVAALARELLINESLKEPN